MIAVGEIGEEDSTMGAEEGWRRALRMLCQEGWDSDDIVDACAALAEACEENAVGADEIVDLTDEEFEQILDGTLDEQVATAVREIADLYARQDARSDALRRALFDLDAFTYGQDPDGQDPDD